jgi:CubicO group peptidase (beta-lactamase class C family)
MSPTPGRRTLFALIASMVVLPYAFAQDFGRNRSDFEQQIQRIANGLRPANVIAGAPPSKLADRMNELHVPGVSIAIIHGGVIFARGFGAAAIDGAPVRPETLFQAGSISKPVTAVAVLALVQAGKLDLDADVNLSLKAWKIPVNPFTAKVTLRRLLSHSAGISVAGFPGYAAGAPIPSLRNVLNGAPPANTTPIVVDHEPGTRYSYSGGGYTIVQELLGDVTDQPFSKLLDDTVLKPFGMTRSAFIQPLPKEDAAFAATPYLPRGAPVPGGPHTYPELAAAGLWSTPTDLARFALGVQAAWTGGATPVLSQATTEEMLKPGLGNYGLGLIVRGAAPHRYFTHDGVNDGFVNTMMVFENGDGAVIMTNGAGGGQLVREIMHSIAVEYDWPDYQPKIHQRVSVSPQSLDRLVGTYRLSPTLTIEISRDGDQLFVQATGQKRFEILAESERDFFVSALDAAMTFDGDEHGHATQLILHQDGVDRVAERVE